MSAERTAPHDRPDQSSAKPARTGLSGLQVATSALASASTAVVMSFFGVAGTVIGAALASVITTLTAAFYGASLRRTTDRLNRLRTHGSPATPAAAGAPAPAVRQRTPALPGRLDPRRAPARRAPRWSRVAVGAAAVFGLAMVLITSIELIGQRPVSALVGASSVRDATTVGELAGGGSTASTPPATPSGTSPAPSPASSAPPTQTGESTAPAPTTTRRPSTAPSSEPTARSSAPRSPGGGAGATAPGVPTVAPTGAP